MIPATTVASLHVCHDVTIDLASREVTLARIFYEIATPIYPSNSKPFWAFVERYGPIGRGKLEVIVYALDDQQALYYLQDKIDFADRLSPVYL